MALSVKKATPKVLGFLDSRARLPLLVKAEAVTAIASDPHSAVEISWLRGMPQCVHCEAILLSVRLCPLFDLSSIYRNL